MGNLSSKIRGTWRPCLAFLSLPLEIRLDIYEMLCNWAKLESLVLSIHKGEIGVCRDVKEDRPPASVSTLLNLASTCRQIRAELEPYMRRRLCITVDYYEKTMFQIATANHYLEHHLAGVPSFAGHKLGAYVRQINKTLNFDKERQIAGFLWHAHAMLLLLDQRCFDPFWKVVAPRGSTIELDDFDLPPRGCPALRVIKRRVRGAAVRRQCRRQTSVRTYQPGEDGVLVQSGLTMLYLFACQRHSALRMVTGLLPGEPVLVLVDDCGRQ